MKTLYNTSDTAEVIKRINSLKPDAHPQWGKMNAGQMLTHCAIALEMGTGEKKFDRLFIGRVLGGFLKKFYSSEQPFKKNSPTDPHLVITDTRNFEQEKQKLITYINKFQAGGEEKCTRHPHPFFGKLSQAEWGIGMHKHLDHHLTQFGV
ncbi:MAG: DUF1569 domain-containing protein [Bacteroidia bacterium]